MTPEQALSSRALPIGLVIFDCDGVLIDSEAVANQVLTRELAALGWALTPEQAQHLFLGMTLPDMEPLIAAKLGRQIPVGWSRHLMGCVVAAMRQDACLVAGALAALDAADALGLPWRVASNSSPEELAAKFARTDLTARVTGRVHSFREVARGKPAPDLFAAAAVAQGVPAAQCLVIEDSVLGATAAKAAGMACLGYAPHDDGAALLAQGAMPFRSMFDVPQFLAIAAKVSA